MFRSFAIEALFGRSAISSFERTWRLCMFGLLAAAIASAMIVMVAPAHAGNTNFLTEKGTINFPFSPPNRATPGPGLIDNMTIGATTPRPGHFTTLDSTSPPSGAGITDLFASPPPIGGTLPAAGAFSTLSASGAVSGAGVAARFAAPGPIGSATPSTGAFTTGNFSGQITTTAGLPTIASGACGTSTNGAVVAGSTNQAGSITIGASATTACAISFSATLASAPKACTFSPMNAAATAATTLPFVDAPTTAGFVLNGAVLASTNWNYVCL